MTMIDPRLEQIIDLLRDGADSMAEALAADLSAMLLPDGYVAVKREDVDAAHMWLVGLQLGDNYNIVADLRASLLAALTGGGGETAGE